MFIREAGRFESDDDSTSDEIGDRLLRWLNLLGSPCPVKSSLGQGIDQMRARIACDSCNAEFSVPEQALGRKVRCPQCGEAVRVAASATGGAPAPRRSRGSSRAKQHSSFPVLALGVGGGLGVGILLVGVYLLGRSSATPEMVISPASSPILAEAAAATPAPIAAAIPTPEQTPAPVVKSVAVTSPTSEMPADPVTTTVATKETPQEPAPNGPLSPAPTKVLSLPDLIAQVEPAVERINMVLKQGGCQGSGFLVDTRGTIVTNYHVIEEGLRGEVEFHDGVKVPIQGVRHVSPKHDVAILQIELPASKTTVIPLAAELPRKGESVIGFGAPHGLSFTSSQGIISSVRAEKEMHELLGADVAGTWLQTTAPISSGSSGGPLVNESGSVVGINTLTRLGGQNLNFAISSVEIAAVLAAAPEKAEPLDPEKLKPCDSSISRKIAVDEIGTERGRKLMAGLREIYLINATQTKTVVLDATGRIWDRIIVRSRSAVEKCDLEISLGRPSANAALMMVHLEMRSTRKGTVGTQELIVKAELICPDLFANKAESPLVRVWEAEVNAGTIALQALLGGNFPRQADDKLAKFFLGFRRDFMKAVNEEKEAQKAAETPKAEPKAE